MERPLIVSALALCTAFAAPAYGQDQFFSNFVVFGDSLSDPGNIPSTTGIAGGFPPAPYDGNRFSNGLVASQILPTLMTFDSVTNYAHGGAFSGAKPTPDALVPLLGATTGNINNVNPDNIAALQALGVDNAGLAALNQTDMLSQIGSYLATSPTISEHDVFSVWIGANDYFFTANTISAQLSAGAISLADVPAIVEASITETITNIAGSIQALDAAGAEQVMLFNIPDLGATPLGISANADLFSSFSTNHNAALASTAAQLTAFGGPTTYLVDVATLSADTIANPAKYGLTNVDTACLADLACVTDPTAQDSYLFWDDVHPTARSHATIAAFTADTLIAPRTIAAQAEIGAAGGQFFNRQLAGAFDMSQDISPDQNAFVFADISYRDAERDSENYAVGYASDAMTLQLGAAKNIGGLIIGISGAYSDGEASLNGGLGGFDHQALRLGGFVGVANGPFQLVAAAHYSDDDYENITRNTGVADQIAAGETSGDTFGLLVESGYDLALGGQSGGLTLTPLARLSHAKASVDGYSESGATGLDQIVFSRTIDPTDLEAGARLSGDMGLQWRLEGVFVDALDDDDQRVATALVTVPEVQRVLQTEGTDGSYGRISGSAAIDLGGALKLEVGGETTAGREDGEQWGAFVRAGTAF